MSNEYPLRFNLKLSLLYVHLHHDLDIQGCFVCILIMTVISKQDFCLFLILPQTSIIVPIERAQPTRIQAGDSIPRPLRLRGIRQGPGLPAPPSSTQHSGTPPPARPLAHRWGTIPHTITLANGCHHEPRTHSHGQGLLTILPQPASVAVFGLLWIQAQAGEKETQASSKS